EDADARVATPRRYQVRRPVLGAGPLLLCFVVLTGDQDVAGRGAVDRRVVHEVASVVLRVVDLVADARHDDVVAVGAGGRHVEVDAVVDALHPRGVVVRRRAVGERAEQVGVVGRDLPHDAVPRAGGRDRGGGGAGGREGRRWLGRLARSA